MVKTALTLLVLLPSAAWAEMWTVRLDPAATSIQFILGATMHKVNGTFKLKEGEIRFDSKTGKAEGKIAVDAASGDTKNKGRDKKMHKEVLESASYPDFVFVPERIDRPFSPPEKAEFNLQGTLSVHGGTHAVTLPVSVEFKDGKLHARTSFDIPYVEWGMKDPGVFILRVDKKVSVTVEASADLRN
ncbi:MAG TPA: YceI family protein [Bdellovibrionota bacterium]|nr:YceI family protein [Bdellovibrionota bacterium]